VVAVALVRATSAVEGGEGGGGGSVAGGGDDGYVSAAAAVTPSPAERGGGGRPDSTRHPAVLRVEWRLQAFGVPCRPPLLFAAAQPRATPYARRTGSRRVGAAATAAGGAAPAHAADAAVGGGRPRV